MKAHNTILEGLQSRRNDGIITEGYMSAVGEIVEYLPICGADDILSIDEAKAVTFNGRTYPREGWAVVLSGGAGSGKGFTIGKQLMIDAKILDVDDLKLKFAKLSALGKGKFAEYTGNRTFDFKNPKDVSDLHAMIGDEFGFDKRQQQILMNSIKSGNVKPNVIFDITGKTSTKLMNIANMFKRLNYNTSLVWVITNRQVAMVRNLMRERVVGERLFHEIHNQVRDTLLDFIPSNAAKDYDECWIIFSESAEVSDLPKELRDELFKYSAVKLKKKGSAFELPTDLNMRIRNFLGPNEKSPNKPSIYKSFKETEKIIAPYKDDEGKRLKGHNNLNLMKGRR